MKIFLNKNELRKFADSKKSLGFVPTMGAIHPGHISLIRRSLKECNKTIVSILINIKQFKKKKHFIMNPIILKKIFENLRSLKLIIFICLNIKIYIRLDTIKRLKLINLKKNYVEGLDLCILKP